VWSGALPASFGPLGGSTSLSDEIRRGDAVRLPVSEVRETGPFGFCNGPRDACVTDPVPHMSLATESRNVQEMRVVRTPLRLFGVVEVPFGAILSGVGAVDGALNLQNHPTEVRNTTLAIDAGLLVLGGALLANGLWYLLAPAHRSLVYRAPN
jgi:hypothetical protein